MSITLQELTDVILIESGQFIADLSATLLDKQKLILMIRRELAHYSRYTPSKKTIFGKLYNGMVFSIEQHGFIPDNIVDIKTDRYAIMGFSTSPVPQVVHNYHWKYEKPILNMRYPEGDYIYTYIGQHTYDPVNDIMPTINIEDQVINLIIARFLMTVGRSRSAFTIDEIPIATSAAEMINEGRELYEKTEERIRLNSAFQLAILV